MAAAAGANEAWLLASRPGPEGMVAENFRKEQIPVPEVADGEVLLQALLISVDPYMRGRMDEPRGKTYFVGPFEIGQPPFGTVGSKVLLSKHPDFTVGDIVVGMSPWQRYIVSDGSGLRKVDTSKVPLEKHMSCLGYSGLSSYLPIVHIGAPKEGETAFVSGAAGAVGSMACQILKKLGCKVVGSAGSASKLAYLESIGVPSFNYKEGTLAENLAKYCPDGIDIYFENVGGEMLEAVLDQMNDFGRIIACGMVSQYDTPHEQRYGVRNLFQIVGKRLKMQGYIMSDWMNQPEVMEAANRALREMLENGEVKTVETILEGFDQVPTGFLGLFKGDNTGKMLIRVESPST